VTSNSTDPQLPSSPASVSPGDVCDDRALMPVERWDLERRQRLRRVGAAILLVMAPGMFITPALSRSRAKARKPVPRCEGPPSSSEGDATGRLRTGPHRPVRVGASPFEACARP